MIIGFDVYGTLIDTHGVVEQLRPSLGEAAVKFSQLWRDKQLEYTFRRTVMQRYQNFSICTRDALDYTIQFFGCEFTAAQKQDLLQAYATLPAFADVAVALSQLRAHQLYAFSNGQAAAVDSLLSHASIRAYFTDIISVDAVGVFKPSPAVYQHFLTATAVRAESAWLVSSNGFDVMGARSVGMCAAWVRRLPTMVFDPWPAEHAKNEADDTEQSGNAGTSYAPTITVTTLTDLAAAITRATPIAPQPRA